MNAGVPGGVSEVSPRRATGRERRRRRRAREVVPYLIEAMGEFADAGYDYDAEFAFGLELILDGVERLRS